MLQSAESVQILSFVHVIMFGTSLFEGELQYADAVL